MFCKRLKPHLIFTALIRLVMITYLPLLIASGIGRQFNRWYVEAHSWLLVAVLFIFLSTLLFGCFGEKYEQATPEAQKRYGNVFTEVFYRDRWSHLYIFLWVLRRLVFVIALRFSAFPWRLGLFLTFQTLILIYFVYENPFVDKK